MNEIGAGLRRFLGDLDPADRLSGTAAVDMLLIEAFLALAFRAAHQAQRPVPQLRQYPVADRDVIPRQRQLGDALLGVEHPVRIGQPHALEGDAAVGCGGGNLGAGIHAETNPVSAECVIARPQKGASHATPWSKYYAPSLSAEILETVGDDR